MTTPEDFVRHELTTSAAVKRDTASTCAPAITEAAEVLSSALQGGQKVLFCGNGGSAADCQHLAAEFVSALSHDAPRRALPAIALTTDTSFLTANANDFGFEQVFARQVEAFGRPGDVLVAISTSGNSPNVVKALEQARQLGVRTILLTGMHGGRARAVADHAICIPSDSTQHIQEAHIAVGHILCALVERALFPATHGG